MGAALEQTFGQLWGRCNVGRGSCHPQDRDFKNRSQSAQLRSSYFLVADPDSLEAYASLQLPPDELHGPDGNYHQKKKKTKKTKPRFRTGRRGGLWNKHPITSEEVQGETFDG